MMWFGWNGFLKCGYDLQRNICERESHKDVGWSGISTRKREPDGKLKCIPHCRFNFYIKKAQKQTLKKNPLITKAKLWSFFRRKEGDYVRRLQCFCLAEIFPNRKMWRSLSFRTHGHMWICGQGSVVSFPCCLVLTHIFLWPLLS